MEPAPQERPPGAPPAGTKSALAFFAVLLALFPPALVAQWASPVAGLAATQLFAFLLPALVATAGSNLKVAPYLRLGRAPPALVVLGALSGGAGVPRRRRRHGVRRSGSSRRGGSRPTTSRDSSRAPRGSGSRSRRSPPSLAPVCEELTFRGYLQSTLALRRRPGAAIAAGALLFASLHLDPVRFPALLVLGGVFGWLTWRAGSVWPAVAAHAANNGLAAVLLLAFGARRPRRGAARGRARHDARARARAPSRCSSSPSGPPPPEPPPAAVALALVDPASPSIRWTPPASRASSARPRSRARRPSRCSASPASPAGSAAGRDPGDHRARELRQPGAEAAVRSRDDLDAARVAERRRQGAGLARALLGEEHEDAARRERRGRRAVRRDERDPPDLRVGARERERGRAAAAEAGDREAPPGGLGEVTERRRRVVEGALGVGFALRRADAPVLEPERREAGSRRRPGELCDRRRVHPAARPGRRADEERRAARAAVVERLEEEPSGVHQRRSLEVLAGEDHRRILPARRRPAPLRAPRPRPGVRGGIASATIASEVLRVPHPRRRPPPPVRPAARGRARPSTAAERKRAVEATRKLEKQPLARSSAEERTWLLQFIVEAPDFEVRGCSGPLDVLAKSDDGPFAQILYVQSIFGMAAFMFEHPKKAGDWAAVQTAGIESTLKAYESVLRADSDARWKQLDRLVAARNAGKLRKLVEKEMAACGRGEDGGPSPRDAI